MPSKVYTVTHHRADGATDTKHFQGKSRYMESLGHFRSLVRRSISRTIEECEIIWSKDLKETLAYFKRGGEP